MVYHSTCYTTIALGFAYDILLSLKTTKKNSIRLGLFGNQSFGIGVSYKIRLTFAPISVPNLGWIFQIRVIFSASLDNEMAEHGSKTTLASISSSRWQTLQY